MYHTDIIISLKHVLVRIDQKMTRLRYKCILQLQNDVSKTSYEVYHSLTHCCGISVEISTRLVLLRVETRKIILARSETAPGSRLALTDYLCTCLTRYFTVV